ncbi:MAG: peptide chain release factor N(5)-glutamine methyltransferase [Bacteroidales bacterium]|nr:peptide chain release factor N(5)-glutamine methyltransferase [Bacteroidales bacterium]
MSNKIKKAIQRYNKHRNLLSLNRIELKQLFLSSIASLYDERERNAIFRLYVSEKMKIPYYEYCLDIHLIVSEDIDYKKDIERLKQGEPIQYIIGKTFFCGLELKTDSRALIPRSETEELVDIILRENEEIHSVLDIGTGTGAIAVTLARHWNKTEVFAIDISSPALALAAENAALNDVNVHFLRSDILKNDIILPSFDIIVSNPPYVPERDKNDLAINVVDFEPHNAIFVPDDAPLLFYKAIAEFGATHLNNGGKLYFETYESYHAEIVSLLKNYGFVQIKSRNDFAGKTRFISALWQ